MSGNADVTLTIGAMLDQFNKAIFDAKKNMTGLGDDFDKAVARMDKAAKNMSSFGESLTKKLTGPIMLIAAVAGKNFGDAEEKSLMLDAALESIGDTSKETRKSIDDFALSLGKALNVDDDDIKGLITLGIQMGLTKTEAKSAAKEALAMSKVWGGDYESNLMKAAQAHSGNYDKLAKLIPALKQCSTETEKAAVYQKAMASAYDKAAAAAESPIGKIKGYIVTLGNMSEAYGKLIYEKFEPFINLLIAVANYVDGLDESTKSNIVTILLMVAAVGPLILLLGKGIEAYRALAILQAAFTVGMSGNTVAVGANSTSLIANRVGLLAHRIATTYATLATQGFTAALKSNPFIMVASLLIALGVAIYGVAKAYKNSEDAHRKEIKWLEDEERARKGVMAQMDETITNNVNKQDRAYSRLGSIEKKYAAEKQEADNLVKLSSQLRAAVENGSIADSIAAMENYRTAVKKSSVPDDIKKEAEKAYLEMQKMVAYVNRVKGDVNKTPINAVISIVNENYENQVHALNERLLAYQVEWNKKAGETHEQYLDDKHQRETDASKKWREDREKTRKEYADFMRKADKNDIELEAIRYQDDVAKWKDACDKKQISYQEYMAILDVLNRQHAENEDKIYASRKQKEIDAWDSALSTEKSFSDKSKAILDAYKNNAISAGEAAGMGIAAAFTSVLGGLNELMNMYTQNQEKALDNKKNKELKHLEDEYEAQKTAIEKSTKSESEKNKALKALDEKYQRDQDSTNSKYDKKRAKLEYEAAKRQKAMNMFDTAMGIPKAAFDAYNAMVGIPYVGPILAVAAAAAATAFGFAKLALIKQQPLPEYAEGGVFHGRTSIDIGEKGKEMAFPLEGTEGRNAMMLLVTQFWALLEQKLGYAAGAVRSTVQFNNTNEQAKAIGNNGSAPVQYILSLDKIQFAAVLTSLGESGYLHWPASIVVK